MTYTEVESGTDHGNVGLSINLTSGNKDTLFIEQLFNGQHSGRTDIIMLDKKKVPKLIEALQELVK